MDSKIGKLGQIELAIPKKEGGWRKSVWETQTVCQVAEVNSLREIFSQPSLVLNIWR